MKTYLLTGVAGFIASQTASFLCKQGARVIGVDNMNDYYDIRLKEHRLQLLKEISNFYFHRLDIENKADLEKLFEEYQFDAVLNLAARAGVRYSMENPYVYLSTNTRGTLNLMELMRVHQVKKMVLASTSSLYAGQKMPFKENLAVNTPISPYAASKKAAEVMAYTYHYLYGLDISVVRYFTVFGPAGRPDMCIFRFIKWIDEGTPLLLYGDGEQSRDFTYVDDVAHGTIAALKEVGYQIMNIGGGRNPISLNYVIAKIEQHLNKKAVIEYKPVHKADIKETWADIDKAKKILNWQPLISFEKGLELAVDWYLKNKSWLKSVDCREK